MGGKPQGFGDCEQTPARTFTTNEKFLADMDQKVPWQAPIALIKPP